MRVAKLLFLIALAAVLSACASFNSRNQLDTLPVAKLYAKGTQSLRNHNYGAAEQEFQRLIARFPSGKYNEQSQIDLAYAQYKDNKPDDAYSTIDRFIRTYPTNKHIDYAYYLRGLINFDRTSGFVERFVSRDKSRRDQGFRLKAFDDFSQLTRRFPGSKYAPDARQRMIFLRNGLAQFEINVAEFYLRTKAYVAAAHRAKYVIEHYQQAPQAGDALAILANAYSKLGRDKLAAQTDKVLAANYPQHPYLKDKGWPHHPSILRRMIPFSGHH
ncbi:outer membrane protein assembly factor BamD [Oleiagrimonas sp. C23AA]|uniref:outer membrane protein assembly factor BamD n=1 Tax=Oleiagrimonas sp. C23AA TaxID=2719047 RepID=UPI001423140D|nr:outer membrane protein assembly factor BamD [Oleiagrimonas sp. C23AA]NII09952.1 outer membrane protein assembly factor BamD [Oleiagrimonas sp. C23AA]